METNETIVSRDVVALDDRKRTGSVKSLAVDFDLQRVSHYVITSASTGSSLVLPLEKAISVGDSFMTIKSHEDFLPLANSLARALGKNSPTIVGLNMYSCGGDCIGQIKGFEFDTVTGSIAKVVLDDDREFTKDDFVFFAPDFVFVDDGTPTDADKRESLMKDDVEPESEEEALQVEPEQGEEAEAAAEASAESEPEEALELNQEADPEVPVVDEAMKEYLIGKRVAERVVSSDGAFVIEAGEEITDDVLNAAEAADALLLLVMSVND